MSDTIKKDMAEEMKSHIRFIRSLKKAKGSLNSIHQLLFLTAVSAQPGIDSKELDKVMETTTREGKSSIARHLVFKGLISYTLKQRPSNTPNEAPSIMRCHYVTDLGRAYMMKVLGMEGGAA